MQYEHMFFSGYFQMSPPFRLASGRSTTHPKGASPSSYVRRTNTQIALKTCNFFSRSHWQSKLPPMYKAHQSATSFPTRCFVCKLILVMNIAEIVGRFVSAMNGVHMSCRRTPNQLHKRTTRHAFNIAGIGCFAAVAYVALNLVDSSDDEEGSISYLFLYKAY